MSLSTLGITPAARHGLGAYFAPRPPLWDDPRLLRDDASARNLAIALGEARAIVMRGNGAITVGQDLKEAATFAFFLEDAERGERDVRAMGVGTKPGLVDAEEIRARQTLAGGGGERLGMWRRRRDGRGGG